MTVSRPHSPPPDTTSPDSHRPQKQFLSVDFVTALTMQECVERLSCCDEELNQSVTLADDRSFALRRHFAEENVEVMFWGTMEEHERGTWVWGTIFQDRPKGLRLQPWIPAFVVLVMLFMAGEAAIRGAGREVVAWLGILIALALFALWRWWRRYRHGLVMVEWVYETLYVPTHHRSPKRDYPV